MPPPALQKNVDLSTLSDEQLMELIVRQNHEAFAVLVRRYHQRFYKFCYRFLWNREEAQDAVQATFLKLWTKAEHWKPHLNVRFTTWFFRIMVHHCLDLKKKKRPQLFENPHDLEMNLCSDERPTRLAADRQALQHAVQRLSEPQMTAINLCFFEGLSNQEAADVMKIHLKALQSLLMRGKQTLRETLREAGEP